MTKRHTHLEFQETVKTALKGEEKGLTWSQLKKKGKIDYTRPCYTWARKLEKDIGLIRERYGRNVYWKLKGQEC